ncbi:MAG: Ig-like domain-containing protein [Prevotellaceae bacterium]|jgi:hypothetical protein|nr:Ig-like domain-containing protein [Prevotellaceae bacterium]
MKKNLFYMVIAGVVAFASCSKDKNDEGVPVESVIVERNAMSIYVGARDTVKASVYPDNATNKTINFASSDTNVATVDNNGVVLGIASGTAAITASASNGTSTTVNVTVNLMQMKVVTTVSSIDMGLKGTGTAIIDWGDGDKDTVDITVEDPHFNHEFKTTAANHTVTVEGVNMTCLNVGVQGATSVDLSKNPALEHFECWHNIIRELNFSNNPALRYIDCSETALTTEAYNAMYATLHSNTFAGVTKEIKVGNRGAAEDSNQEIATAKGWVFR